MTGALPGDLRMRLLARSPGRFLYHLKSLPTSRVNQVQPFEPI